MASSMIRVNAVEAAAGCDRVGCTTPIKVGDELSMSPSTGKVFHVAKHGPCNGLQNTDLIELGAAVVNTLGIRTASDLAKLAPKGAPKATVAKTRPTVAPKVESTPDPEPAASADPDTAAIVAAVLAALGKS
jgi:hypothetical protein